MAGEDPVIVRLTQIDGKLPNLVVTLQRRAPMPAPRLRDKGTAITLQRDGDAP